MDVGEWYFVDEDWSDGVEENLEGAEKGFSSKRVEEERFKTGWQVCVEAVDAEGFVVG